MNIRPQGKSDGPALAPTAVSAGSPETVFAHATSLRRCSYSTDVWHRSRQYRCESVFHRGWIARSARPGNQVHRRKLVSGRKPGPPVARALPKDLEAVCWAIFALLRFCPPPFFSGDQRFHHGSGCPSLQRRRKQEASRLQNGLGRRRPSHFQDSPHQDCVLGADFAAGVAAGALVGDDEMLLIGRQRDGIHRAMLGAERAADASIGDRVGDQIPAFPSRAAALEMRFELRVEKPQRGKDRIGRGLTQAAKARPSDHFRKCGQIG